VFGDNVLVGPNCCFTTSGHPIDASTRRQNLEYALPITVGSDVWFGAGVIVCPGVTIGSDVVIGAGSVVTHDIPSHVVAVGVPCKPIRQITPEDRR
jgi:acetyltransferase-like isoleucine patch superfamily enzyme